MNKNNQCSINKLIQIYIENFLYSLYLGIVKVRIPVILKMWIQIGLIMCGISNKQFLFVHSIYYWFCSYKNIDNAYWSLILRSSILRPGLNAFDPRRELFPSKLHFFLSMWLQLLFILLSPYTYFFVVTCLKYTSLLLQYTYRF